MCNYEKLVQTLQQFAEQSKLKPLTIGEALDSVNEAGYAFIAIILVLPFLQPFPLGPVTVLGGATFLTLGWQLYKGFESPVLPAKIRSVEFSAATWQKLIAVCLKIISWSQKISKPRNASLVTGERGQKIGGLILIAGGALMIIPFGVLPLNNLLPGLAILFYCIGELQEDGLMFYIAFFWLIITVIYFCAFFFVLFYFGKEALSMFQF